MFKRFTSVADVDDVVKTVDQSLAIKSSEEEMWPVGKGKTLGLVFMNPSLRTRMSTQLAARRLGMDVVVMSAGSETWQIEFNDGAVMDGQTVEHIKDAAAVMGLYCDVIGLRAFPGLTDKAKDTEEWVMESFIKYCHKPFLSLESATRHPLQSLADLMTIQEHSLTERPKVLLSWAPHIKPIPHAVTNSFSEWVLKWGKADLFIANPEGYDLSSQFTQGAQIIRNPMEMKGEADFVYFKNWSSFEYYGQMPEANFEPFRQQSQFLGSGAKVMHCLPVRRNVELIDELIDGPDSLVLKQAENRIYAAQWALLNLLK